MPKQRERNAISKSSDRVASVGYQRFAIKLAFDGTTYNGFQSQPNKNTVQDQIEHRLSGLLRRQVRIIAWGRTDAGVHAKGAVVTIDLSLDEVSKFSTRAPALATGDESDVLKAARFLQSVRYPCNSGVDAQSYQNRSGSITNISVVPVRGDFDARYSALWKRYVYYICAGADAAADRLPFAWSRYSWQMQHSLDLDAIVQAADLISGKHNFEWMCVTQPGELRDPLREVSLKVERVPTANSANNAPFFLQQSNAAVLYKVSGTCDLFLYRMMRRIVGVLVAVGKHDISFDDLKRCIDEHDGDGSSMQTKQSIHPKLLETAPPHGLCLEHIEYEEF